MIVVDEDKKEEREVEDVTRKEVEGGRERGGERVAAGGRIGEGDGKGRRRGGGGDCSFTSGNDLWVI